MDRNCYHVAKYHQILPSLSARRAWIEIGSADYVQYNYKSLSARRAWIEIILFPVSEPYEASLSARRAWIEMERVNSMLTLIQVALRKESVDRNPPIWTLTAHKI